MTESSEVLWCIKCDRRKTFVISGSGRKGVCMACGTEIKDLPEARCKAVHDCLFEMLGAVSNGVDK